MAPDAAIAAGEAATHRIVARASIAGAGAIYQQAVSFLSGLLVARVLGAADFGVFNLARQVADLTGVATRLGLDLGLQRHLGENGGARTGILRRLRLVAAGVAALPALAVAAGAGALLERGVFPHAHFADALLGLLLVLPFATDLAVLGGAYRGALRLGPAVLAESVMLPTVRLAAIVLLFLAGFRLGAVVAGSMLATLVAALALAARAGRDFPAGRPAPAGAWTAAWRVVGYSSVLSASVLVTALAANLDLLLLGHFASAEVTGRYALVKTLLLTMGLCAIAFGQGLGALVASRHARGDLRGMADVIAATVRWVTLGTLPVYALFLFWGAGLTGLFGPEFRAPTAVVAWLATGQYCLALLGPAGWALSMTGRQAAELGILCAGAVLAACLGVFAIPRYGAPGAAAGAAVAVAAVSVARLLLARRVAGRWPVDGAVIRITAFGVALAWLADLLSEALPWPEPWRRAAGAASFLLLYAAGVWTRVLDGDERTLLRRAWRGLAFVRTGGEAR